VPDVQRAEDRVMCLACYKPTRFADLALGPDGIPTDLCRWCDFEFVPLGDCEPAWAPPRRTIDLPDIDTCPVKLVDTDCFTEGEPWVFVIEPDMTEDDDE